MMNLTAIFLYLWFSSLVNGQLPPGFFATPKPSLTGQPTIASPTREPTLPIPSRTPSSAKPFFFPTANPTLTVLDPNNAYTWGRPYPQSCQCVVSGAAKVSCEQFKCSCTCDLTAGKCDYNCCCDPDCSAQQVKRFTTLNACEFNGEVANSTVFCYDDNTLYGVNPKTPLGSAAPPLQSAVANALCVTKINNYFAGDYYGISPIVSSTVFNTADGKKAFNYIPTSSATLAVDNFYDQNDSIAAFTLLQSSKQKQQLVSNGPGLFELPLSDFSGVCNDLNFVTFENNVDSSRCNRPIPSDPIAFSSQCNNQLSTLKYVSNLYIANNDMSNVNTTHDCRFHRVCCIGGRCAGESGVGVVQGLPVRSNDGH